MQHEDFSSALAWLKHAKSDLLISKLGDRDEILLNQLCFHAQQSAEKSLKAVLKHLDANINYTHNLKTLVEELEENQKVSIPDFFRELPILNSFAVTTRYPGDYEEISEWEYEEAVDLAEKTYEWAKDYIERSI